MHSPVRNEFPRLPWHHMTALNGGTPVSDLTSYGAEAWRTKENTGLKVRNFHQSHVLYMKLWLIRELYYGILDCSH